MSISVTIRRHHWSRQIRITIRPDATILVTAPRRTSLRVIERVIRERSGWIRSMIATVPREEKSTGVQKMHRIQQTRELVTHLVDEYCTFYGVVCGRVSVRDQRSRWGSCSSAGNLNFNYRLAVMPTDLVHYVVAHEVCHLVELNHSPRFWRLLALAIPDYKMRRKALRAWGTIG